MKRTLLIFVTLLTLTACGGGTPAPSSTTPSTNAPESPTIPAPAPVAATTTATVTVKMGSDSGQLKFVPATLTVKPGDTIAWVMNKSGPHNVVFDSAGTPDAEVAQALSQSKLLSKPGASYISTVPTTAKAGVYKFHCVPHKTAGMVGVLTIAP